MARHRNFRNLDYSEEYGYDDVYGKSLEEEVAVSPSTAAEFIYQRNSREIPSLKTFLDRRADPEAPPTTTLSSPLATTSSTATPRLDVVGPPPGFPPMARGQVPIRITAEGSQRSGDIEVITKRVASSSLKPKRGFVTAGRSLDDGLIHSGTPSPSRSPYASPARSPSPTHATPTQRPALTPQRSKSKFNRVDVLTEYKEREKTSKGQINLVVIGHVDAGKSTLMGHMLYLLGNVSKKAMHKYEQESQKVGKGSFAYAWVLDETGEERHRGITMDVGQYMFETPSRLVNLLDAPGHKDFIPNMITGAAQADVAVLVVNATVGEFEAGFEAGGQTREHALLVRSLGVRQLTVAVNKMDTVDWSQTRFNDVEQKLKLFLKQAGFKESDVNYVPCSGLTGDNLMTTPSLPELTSWYSGPTLLQRIDQFRSPPRPVDKPFRCCIADIFKGQGSGFNVSGRLESGHVQVGQSVLIQPANEVATIKALSVSEGQSSWAAAGDQVILTLIGLDSAKVSIGSVLCSQDQPIRAVTRLEARVIVFNIDIPITIGFPVVLHYQSLNEPAVVTKLLSLLNKNTGELLRKKPRCLTKNSSAIIRLDVSRPICLELYQDCKELGRFMIRAGGNTIAAGVVTKIIQ
ncbi:HBS1-like protein [Halichondria panicea]|uniref:HBS1-like protein n=1 Tax=Halichondria panicea TaxID=6063 RepID=UPI00312B63F4